ncbi:hypothetical protein KC460_00745 [Candidatus Dependentiae bacterium]|nr:hypothetical protein [Candidatus Dependentiae bacterium]
MLRVLTTTFLSMFLTFSLIQANQTDQTDGYRDKRPFYSSSLVQTVYQRPGIVSVLVHGGIAFLFRKKISTGLHYWRTFHFLKRVPKMIINPFIAFLYPKVMPYCVPTIALWISYNWVKNLTEDHCHNVLRQNNLPHKNKGKLFSNCGTDCINFDR